MMGRPPRGHPPKPPRVTLPRARDHRDILKTRSLELIRKIEDKDKYGIFLEPVNADEVPGYADVISRPMDLSTIRKSITMGVYRTPAELRADIDLIWANCIKFNADGSIYYREAVRLRALAGKYFEEFLRNLSRDGLPYGPRRAGPAQNRTAQQPGVSLAASSAQLKAAAAASLPTPAQRLRNIARARRKALLESAPQTELTPIERAAADAAAKLLPASEKTQIYNGPYQRLRRFPNAPAATSFPFVRGTSLQQRLEPFPPAWNALWRRRHNTTQSSNLTNQELAYEMHIAQCYENYVGQSAPIARRLLATLLDPLVVVDHDENLAVKQAIALNDSPDIQKGTVERDTREEHSGSSVELPAAPNNEARPVVPNAPSPKKRPRHGEMHDASSPIFAPLSRAQHELVLEPSQMKNNDVQKQKSQAVEPPSPGAVQELRNALKAYNLDDSFLSGILNSSNNSKRNGNLYANEADDSFGTQTVAQTPPETASKSGKTVDENPASMDVDLGINPDDETATLRERVEPLSNESTDNIDDIYIPSSPAKPTTDNPSVSESDDNFGEDDSDSGGSESGDGEDVADSDSDESVTSICEKDAELDELLRNNHDTLLNLLRVRALKEVASGIARKDLQAEEEKYAVMLREGVALATSKLPPNLLIPLEQAAEVALVAAKQTLGRKRRRDEMEERNKTRLEKIRLAEQEQVAQGNMTPLGVTAANANSTSKSGGKSLVTKPRTALKSSNDEHANGSASPSSRATKLPVSSITPVKIESTTPKVSAGNGHANGIASAISKVQVVAETSTDISKSNKGVAILNGKEGTVSNGAPVN